MRFFLWTILFLSIAPLANAGTCNGKPEPRICDGSCFTNHDCKKGKWEVSGREVCEPCQVDESNLCGGKPMPLICHGNCYENYDCVKGKWEISGREICMQCRH